MMRIAASGDHQMMFLMMHASRDHARKSKHTERPGIFRRRDDSQVRARLGLGDGEFPVAGEKHDSPIDAHDM